MWFADWLRARNSSLAQAEAKRLTILAVSPALEDLDILDLLSARHGWQMKPARSLREAFRLLSERTFDIVLCDSNPPGHPWQEIMSRLARVSRGAAIVLIAPAKDDLLWLEVLSRGGFDVLARPLGEQALRRVMDAAVLCDRLGCGA